MATITGTAGNDTITGSRDPDVLYGLDGNDVLDGYAGNDSLIGDLGDDVLRGLEGGDALDGGPGNDLLDGGERRDAATYANAPGPVVVDLAAGTATGAYGNDTLVGIESVSASDYDDVVTGSSTGNYLYGSTGNDTLQGGAGADTLSGGLGDDLMDGGSGVDGTGYGGVQGPVAVDLSTGVARSALGNDTLIGIEDVGGSPFDDTLTGSTARNWLVGLDGNDVLRGLAGNDRLSGGAGDDLLDGGKDFDRVDYFDATSALSIDLGAGTVSGPVGNDTLVGIEMVEASYFDDTLIGSAADNWIIGHDGDDLVQGLAGDDYLFGDAGNDTLEGLSGDDFLRGGPGDDLLDGGAGLQDVADYWDAPGPVAINLVTGSASGAHGNDTLIGIEVVNGSTYDDEIVGRPGIDTVTFENSDGSVTVRLADGVAVGDGNDSISGITGVVGSPFSDSLYGDSADNTLDGGGGADLLSGGAGGDTYYVDDPGDMVSELPDLALNGAAALHSRRIDFDPDATANAIDTVIAQISYTLRANVENLRLAGTAALSGTGNELDNVLRGNASANELAGVDGADILDGSGGNDTLSGGAGSDTLGGGAAADVLRGGAGADVLRGGSGADSFSFDTALAAGNVDTVLDFAPGTDRVSLEAEVFEALPPGVTVTPDQFRAYAGASNAITPEQRLVYDTATGKLYYDADGAGGTAAVAFAILGTTVHPNISAADFVIFG